MKACHWCGKRYTDELTRTIELKHLLECPVYQTLPVAEWIEGKQYVRLPSHPHILVERLQHVN